MEDTKILVEIKEMLDQYFKPLQKLRDEMDKTYQEYYLKNYRKGKIDTHRFIVAGRVLSCLEKLYNSCLESRRNTKELFDFLDELQSREELIALLQEEGEEE